MSLRFPALRWTTLLLAASIGLTTIGVVEASRAVRSQRAVVEHALRDYAGFAAWSYQQHLRARLGGATHRDGAPLVRVYGPRDRYDGGGTIAFNVLDAHGIVVPYDAVEQRARHQRISLRGGCFCNPGASEVAFGFIADRSAECIEETRRAGWSLTDFSARMRATGASHAVGAVRASIGIPTNGEDVGRLIALVADFQNSH